MIWSLTIIVVACVFVYSILPNLLTRLLFLGVLRKIPHDAQTGGKRPVCLTFDDGPDPAYTPRVLDALQGANVKATFFIIYEKAEKHPDIVERMIRDGHDVQIHGYTHAFVPLVGPRHALCNVADSQKLLKSRFGVQAKFYRPTWGLLNLPVLLDSWRMNYKLVTWSIMVGDWKVTTAETLYQRIMKRIHSGAVIVLHDSDETWGAERLAPEAVIELLPTLIKTLLESGYEFKRISEARPFASAGEPTNQVSDIG